MRALLPALVLGTLVVSLGVALASRKGVAAPARYAPGPNGAFGAAPAGPIAPGAPAAPGGAAPAPSSAVRLLLAEPFVLGAPYVHAWRAERPEVRAGYVLALACDPALVEPRQTAEPVLLVGDQTPERVNAPGASGVLVAIVPAPLAPDGSVALDLTRAPVRFGTPELPERVDASWIAAELARAPGAPAFSAAAVASAGAAGRGTQHLADRAALDLELARVVESVSPAERDLVRGLRAPRVR